jgi:hypothetical protein
MSILILNYTDGGLSMVSSIGIRSLNRKQGRYRPYIRAKYAAISLSG